MELWDVYTYDRIKTGRTIQRGARLQPGEYHLVADMWIMDCQGRLLIQQRSLEKESAPGLWCCTGGSITAGEESLPGMIREMKEELGVAPDVSNTRMAFSCHGRNSIKDIYVIRQDIPMDAFRLQKEEVIQVKWVSLAELKALVRDESTFHQLGYFDELFAVLDKEAY